MNTRVSGEGAEGQGGRPYSSEMQLVAAELTGLGMFAPRLALGGRMAWISEDIEAESSPLHVLQAEVYLFGSLRMPAPQSWPAVAAGASASVGSWISTRRCAAGAGQTDPSLSLQATPLAVPCDISSRMSQPSLRARTHAAASGGTSIAAGAAHTRARPDTAPRRTAIDAR